MSTEKIKDGGPAFPESRASKYVVSGPNGHPQPMFETVGGMSLRDWFAGEAAPAILIELYERCRRENAGVENAYTIAASASYELADAMLKAREVQS